jgi:3-O-methylgallate 3,4-dioxygenase
MAEIVLGIGTSHSPQVSAPVAGWTDFVASDQARSTLVLRGEKYTFDELVELRAAAGIAGDLGMEAWRRMHAASQAAIAELSRTLAEAAADVVIIVGDDQDEVLHEDNQPAVLVYWGEDIHGRPRHYADSVAAGIRAAGWAFGEVERDYPVASGLGRFVIEELTKAQFDVASSRRLPGHSAMGHAFAFVYRRLMDREIVPTLPVMLNTYLPPNQPTPGRCYALGRALRAAVEAWPGDERVAVVASGGLSHFVIDEELDQLVLTAIRDRDEDSLAAIPREWFVSGTSETLNWITAAGAVEHLDMELLDYVPGYRTPAGTGCAMAFARWRPAGPSGPAARAAAESGGAQ